MLHFLSFILLCLERGDYPSIYVDIFGSSWPPGLTTPASIGMTEASPHCCPLPLTDMWVRRTNGCCLHGLLFFSLSCGHLKPWTARSPECSFQTETKIPCLDPEPPKEVSGSHPEEDISLTTGLGYPPGSSGLPPRYGSNFSAGHIARERPRVPRKRQESNTLPFPPSALQGVRKPRLQCWETGAAAARETGPQSFPLSLTLGPSFSVP